jgi:hemolysin activation/secretion protein
VDVHEELKEHEELNEHEELLVLPQVAGRYRIERESLRGLAEQFETALERSFVLVSGDERTMLDFEVAARPLADGRVVELTASFVGPAAAPAIPVRRFVLRYRGGDGSLLRTEPEVRSAEAPESDRVPYDLPSSESVLAATTVTLFRVRDGERSYLTDWPGDFHAAERVDLRLDTVFEQPEMLSISALQAVFQSVLLTLQAEEGEGGVAGGDLLGVFVEADPGELDLARGGLDLRPAGADGVFAIHATPGIVSSVRTTASGERVPAEERANPSDPRFARILARSPFQPESDLPQVLREAPLRAFLDRQTRHPNRRVDAAVTAAEWSAALDAQGADGPRWREQGTVGLDFRVTENKPWSVLVQGSNTGIESTGKWQTRVGYFNSDLFGNDEIFSLEFVTTNLEDSNTVSAYFDAPIGESEHLRWKLFAGHSEYTASDVGFVFADFEGKSPRVGGELEWNVAQWGKTFLDLVGGVTWTNVEALNGLTRDRGDESFLVPYIGARLQRNDRGAVTDFSLNLEFGFGEGSRIVELNRLGRLFPDSEWQVLRWDFAQSFYLDPWFQDKADLATATLAHELYFRFHGQNSLGHRLVPQFMGTAGGFYTVRGYPTSVAAGDNVYIFTGEYRLHLPQLLGFDANPQPFMGIGTEPFRLRPQFGYGPTDWDLIFRAFVDAAVVRNVNRFSFETDEELIGAGFGVELQMQKGIGHPVLRNLSLRLDVGYPLKDLDFVKVDDVQVTFVGSLAF